MANIGSEANIGNNAEIGASAGIGDEAKIGAKAYGEQDEPEPPVPPTPQGVVLYDGAVTLADSGQGGLEGQIELEEMPIVGKAYTIVINGNSFTGMTEDDEGEITISAINGGSGAVLNIYEGAVTFICSPDVGQVGENTLHIEEAGFFVAPSELVASIGQATQIFVYGEVASYESSDTSIAIVLEHQGEYAIQGVANGTCTVTFISVSGETAHISVTVQSIS